MYEGGDKCKGVYLTGLTPEQSVLPTINWLCNNMHVKRWFFVGSDYIWPKTTHNSAIKFLSKSRRSVIASEYFPLNCQDFSRVLDSIERTQPDVVVINLLGNSSIAFNRQFARRGLDNSILRYCGAIEENMLYAIGHNNCENLISSMGFFDDLDTNEANAFKKLYCNSFGEFAPALNQISVSCYEGIMLLANLAQQCQSLLTDDFEKITSKSIGFESPRGELTLDNKNVHADVFIVQANNNRFVPLHRISQI
jgi:ABC-type branched-subunit amino acid transport system substrate-binding protein